MVTPAPDHVLTRYLALNEDLMALATETGHSIPALLDWLHTPEIAPTLARYHAHQAHQLTAFALQALAAIISSTPDLIEQRRAATTILQTVNGPAISRPRTRLDLDPFDRGDDLQDHTGDLDEDEPFEPADLAVGDLDDDSDEADNLEADDLGAKELVAARYPAHAKDLNKAPTPPPEKVELKLPPSPAPVPPSALSTQHSALPPALSTPQYTPPHTGPPQRNPPDSHKLLVHARP